MDSGWNYRQAVFLTRPEGGFYVITMIIFNFVSRMGETKIGTAIFPGNGCSNASRVKSARRLSNRKGRGVVHVGGLRCDHQMVSCHSEKLATEDLSQSPSVWKEVKDGIDDNRASMSPKCLGTSLLRPRQFMYNDPNENLSLDRWQNGSFR
jgi:hypothetical protein